jgi:uncharacterized protein involved in exopolysaccharide biosynthesis/Mrp family chromosome partitioning ATPase
MIKSYWLRIVICALLGLGIGYLTALVTPKQYDAIAEILVDQKQYMPSRAQNAAEESVVDLVEFGRSRSVETQVELLTSYGTLQRAAETVLERIPDARTRVGDEIDPIELQQRVNVSATKDSDVVTLRVRMADPKVAEAVADEIYRAFDRTNTVNSKRGAERAIRSLENQLEQIEAELRKIDDRSQKLEEEFSAPDIQQEIMTTYQTAKDLEAAVDGATAGVAGLEERIRALRELISRTPQRLVSGEVDVRNPTITRLEDTLAQLRIDRDSLLLRFMPDREEIRLLDRQILETEAAIKKLRLRNPAERTTVINPIYQSLQNELVVAQAGLRETKAKLASAQTAFAREQQKLLDLPLLKRRVTENLRTQSVLEKNYVTYYDRLESLRAAAQGRIAASTMTTAAVGIPRPMVPNVPLNVTIGFALGLALGILWSVSTESKRSPIRTVGQLNRLSLQPAYRHIPMLRHPYRGLQNAPAESFETLLLNFVRSEKKGYRMGLVGVSAGAGATTASINLAIAASRGGYSVFLIETDPSRPIRRRLGRGIADNEDGQWSANDLLTVYPLLTHGANSFAIPEEVKQAAEGKDLVIFDFLPAISSADAALLASELDEIILLVQLGTTRTIDFLHAQQALIDAGCENITVVVSKTTETSEDVPLIEKDLQQKALSGPEEPEGDQRA